MSIWVPIYFTAHFLLDFNNITASTPARLSVYQRVPHQHASVFTSEYHTSTPQCLPASTTPAHLSVYQRVPHQHTSVFTSEYHTSTPQCLPESIAHQHASVFTREYRMIDDAPVCDELSHKCHTTIPRFSLARPMCKCLHISLISLPPTQSSGTFKCQLATSIIVIGRSRFTSGQLFIGIGSVNAEYFSPVVVVCKITIVCEVYWKLRICICDPCADDLGYA